MSFKRDGDVTNLLKSLNVSAFLFFYLYLLFMILSLLGRPIYSLKGEAILLKNKEDLAKSRPIGPFKTSVDMQVINHK